MQIKEKWTMKLEGAGEEWADWMWMWLAATSGESTCRYGMDREITSSSLSDLLSLLRVPASSVWQDWACPDHNYALAYLPARPPTTKNPTLHPPPVPCTTPHPSSTSSPPPLTFNTPPKHSPLSFHTLFHVLTCFAEQNCLIRTEENLLFLSFFYELHLLNHIPLYHIYSYIVLFLAMLAQPCWQSCLLI